MDNNLFVTVDDSSNTINVFIDGARATGPGNGLQGAENVGTGANVYQSTDSNSIIYFRSLKSMNNLLSVAVDSDNNEVDFTVNESNLTISESQVSGLSADLASINSSLSSLASEITSLTTTVGNNSTAISGLETSVTSINSQISSINTSITSIENSLTTLGSDIVTLQGDITSINSQISTINGTLTTLTNGLNAMNILTTKGDLLTFNGTTYIRLPAGSNGQILSADNTQASGLKWENAPSVASTLESLTDVTITSAVSGQILSWNGSAWINENAPSSSYSLEQLTDVTITSSVAGQILSWNGSKWVNVNAPTGDMTKAVYDPTNSGSVVNSQALNGQSATYYLNRANQTGTQASSTISDFSTATNTLIQATNLEQLADVSVASIANGQFLSWNGSKWVNVTLTTVTALSGLSDVSVSSPTNGQVLTYNSTTSKWTNQTSTSYAPSGSAYQVQIKASTTGFSNAYLYAEPDNSNQSSGFVGYFSPANQVVPVGGQVGLASSNIQKTYTKFKAKPFTYFVGTGATGARDTYEFQPYMAGRQIRYWIPTSLTVDTVGMQHILTGNQNTRTITPGASGTSAYQQWTRMGFDTNTAIGSVAGTSSGELTLIPQNLYIHAIFHLNAMASDSEFFCGFINQLTLTPSAGISSGNGITMGIGADAADTTLYLMVNGTKYNTFFSKSPDGTVIDFRMMIMGSSEANFWVQNINNNNAEANGGSSFSKNVQSGLPAATTLYQAMCQVTNGETSSNTSGIDIMKIYIESLF